MNTLRKHSWDDCRNINHVVIIIKLVQKNKENIQLWKQKNEQKQSKYSCDPFSSWKITQGLRRKHWDKKATWPKTVNNDASARFTSLSSAFCDLDLLPQSWSVHPLAPRSTCANLASKSVHSFSKYHVHKFGNECTDRLSTWLSYVDRHHWTLDIALLHSIPPLRVPVGMLPWHLIWKNSISVVPDGDKNLKICLFVSSKSINVTDGCKDRQTPRDGTGNTIALCDLNYNLTTVF